MSNQLNELLAVMRDQYINEDDYSLLMTLEQALAIAPADKFLLNFKAEMLLRYHAYVPGWTLWENRETRLKLIERNAELPLWDGSDLNGRTLLVAGEQGIGDHIMYARYLPTLSKKNGRVIVYHQMPFIMDRLMSSVTPSIQACSGKLLVDTVDCWIPMGSLPLVLKQYTPTPESYITVEPKKLEIDLFKVGLCWQGNPTHPFDAFRSMPFANFNTLLTDKRCMFYSLQKGESNGLVNLCNDTNDMYDVAAMIASLDMVITVDTSIAHLAGAMGKKVWILLPKPFDWRWGTPEDPTYWYPNARYFWQKTKWHSSEPWKGIMDDVLDYFA